MRLHRRLLGTGKSLSFVSYGYQNLGTLAFCEDTQAANTLPLKRFYKGPPETDHFYTIQQSDADLVASLGWGFEGNACFVYPYQAAETSPMYRVSLWNPTNGDLVHSFTLSSYERDSFVAQGWSNDGVAGYVYTQAAVSAPTCSSGFASPATIYPGQTTTLTLSCSGTVTSYVYQGGPPGQSPISQSTQPVTAGPTNSIGQFIFQGVGCNSQGCSNSIAIAVNVVPNPNAPALVQAATFTASCADRYCIRITGFNFAANSRVDMWQGSTYIGTLYPTLRTTNGEASVVEITLTDPNLRNALNVESPKFNVAVVNPGFPGAASSQLQVLRATTNTVTGWVDSYSSPMPAPTNGTELKGWACFFGSPAIPVRIHEGAIDGPIVGSPKADQSGNATVAQLCGGNGDRYFTFRWPDKFRDGVPRRFYVTADIHLIMNAVPNDILIGNSPISVTLPNVAKRAEFVSLEFLQPLGASDIVTGNLYTVRLKYKNIGSASWNKATGFTLKSLTPFDNTIWGISRVALPSDVVQPGEITTFQFDVRAPATAGSYAMQWSMAQDFVDYFGDPTNLINVSVKNPTAASAPSIETEVTPLMIAGQTYTVKLKYTNRGTTAWNPGIITLRQVSPGNTWFPANYGSLLTTQANSVPLAQSVAPGGVATFSFSVLAPPISGRHNLGWQLFASGVSIPLTDTSRDLAVATIADVTPPGSPPPVDQRPVPPVPDF